MTKCFVVVLAHNGGFNAVVNNNISAFVSMPVKNNDMSSLLRDISLGFRKKINNKLINRLEKDSMGKLLLYLNTEDFQIVRIEDIGLFQFNCDLKVWEVILASMDKPVRLKRNENRWSILALDNCLVQVNQKYIINEKYLKKVEDGVCYLDPPFDHLDYVRVGSFFRKKLVEHYHVL